jgi:hypothetical protein
MLVKVPDVKVRVVLIDHVAIENIGASRASKWRLAMDNQAAKRGLNSFA